MVVVFKYGCVPITYSANLCSCATLLTVILYCSALVVPYLLSGWSSMFFPTTEFRYERPMVFQKPRISFSLNNGSNIITYAFPSTANTVYPVYEITNTDNYSLQFSITFPFGIKSPISGVQMDVYYDVNFSNIIEETFEGKSSIVLDSHAPSCSATVLGSLGVYQEKPYSKRRISFPTPKGYEEYSEMNNLPMTQMDKRMYGKPIFNIRNIDYTYGVCESYQISFFMRSPLITLIVEKNPWYSFLGGWTTYIALAIPMFYAVFKILECMFGSGLVPVNKRIEAQLNDEKIPKFNR